MKIRYAVAPLFLIFICACEPKVTFDYTERTHYIPIGRKCKYAWAFNAYNEKLVDRWGDNYTLMQPYKKDTAIRVNDYILGFSTCNVDIKDLKGISYLKSLERLGDELLMHEPPFYFLSYEKDNMADPPDPVIEARLKQQLENPRTRVAHGMPAADLVKVDYRLTWLKDIKITCSERIAGRAPSQSLSDLFVVDSYHQDHYFIVTSNKNVITDHQKIAGISLSQYLSYKPMAPAEIFLRFKEGVNVSAPVTAQFTVELITGEDKSIKTTAAAVKFVP